MVTIEVLGPGSAGSRITFHIVQDVVEESGLDFRVVRNESIERRVELGLTLVPGIAVNGQIVFAGGIPDADDVRHALGIA